jgi:dimethylamine/trimethylamine dehydrogenase
MARDAKYDLLFDPITIGPKQMRNRFYKTPHCTSFGSERPGTQAYFRATAAEGGWAAVSTEVCSIDPSSDDSPFVMARIWDDTDVRNLGLMTERVHAHGALAGVELWYGAAHTANYETRVAARGVSQLACEWGLLQSCAELSVTEIHELQSLYVAAAERSVLAGFDIINVYGGHGGPITYQFLDTFWNKRTDEYGGSFRRRARFWLETIERIKEAVGDRCAIAVRMSMDSLRPGGPGVEDTVSFMELADPLVDLWDMQVGSVNSEWGDDALASRFAPENFQRPWIEQVRPHTKKPIVGVGRFTSPDVMAEMVRTGTLDLIGSARGSIADPFLPRKIETGRLDEIRECIGCNICVSRVNQCAPLICTQNATAGEEYRRGWHPEEFTTATNADQDVLVVGAGPAGMECAIVLAKRGMRRVHLVDLAPDIGGCINWVSRLPGLGEWKRVVDYRRIQLQKLRQVEVITNARLNAGAVLDYGAEIVVIATGASWSATGLSGVTREDIPGAALHGSHVFTPEQIMKDGASPLGPRVLVYDCEGYFTAVGIAELLADEGRQVVLVTPHAQVAPFLNFTMEGPRVQRMLRQKRIELLPGHIVTEIKAGGVSVADVYQLDVERDRAADDIVLVTQRASEDQLYRELEADADSITSAGIVGLYRIGDCNAPRLIADAVFDGHRLAREIDSSDPSRALPFIRENRVVGASDDDYDGVLRDSPSARSVSSRAVTDPRSSGIVV